VGPLDWVKGRNTTATPQNTEIRVYYGGPTSNPTSLTTVGDSISNNDNKRLGYVKWLTDSSTAPVWPNQDGTWPTNKDFFTLVGWEKVNTTLGSTVVSTSNDTTTGITVTNGVITVKVQSNPSLNNRVALTSTNSSNPFAQFYNMAINAPASTGGVGGGGGVSVSP